MRRRVIASVDIPSAESCLMSVLERTVIGPSAPGVGGMVVLRAWLVLSKGRQKCLRMGHETEVEV